MSDDGTPIPLPPEWRETAEQVVRNLGLPADLANTPPENWQRVLGAVEQRMRMRGVAPPDGWRDTLAGQVGRSDPATTAGPES